MKAQKYVCRHDCIIPKWITIYRTIPYAWIASYDAHNQQQIYSTQHDSIWNGLVDCTNIESTDLFMTVHWRKCKIFSNRFDSRAGPGRFFALHFWLLAFCKWKLCSCIATKQCITMKWLLLLWWVVLILFIEGNNIHHLFETNVQYIFFSQSKYFKHCIVDLIRCWWKLSHFRTESGFT